MKADSEKIHSLIRENLDYFQAQEDSEDWKNYVEYLDDVVLDGLFECVHCSLSYFLTNTDKENVGDDAIPFMEAKFELQVKFILCEHLQMQYLRGPPMILGWHGTFVISFSTTLLFALQTYPRFCYSNNS